MLLEGLHTLSGWCIRTEKKSNWFKSGDLGDQSTQPPYPMIFYWNVSQKYCWAFYNLCRGAPSCWIHKFSGSHKGKSLTKSDIASSRSFNIIVPFTCSCKTTCESVYFCSLRIRHLSNSLLHVELRQKFLDFSATRWWMFYLLCIVLSKKHASSVCMVSGRKDTSNCNWYMIKLQKSLCLWEFPCH